MRLFIGTPTPLKCFKTLKEELSPFINGKWSKEENLHLTHKFIGEDDPEKWHIPLSVPKEEITISGFGIFNKKILYLKASSTHINAIAKELNVPNFVPHITLCRMKSFQPKLLEKLQSLEIKEEANFEVYLYQSTLTQNGPIYKKIWKY